MSSHVESMSVTPQSVSIDGADYTGPQVTIQIAQADADRLAAHFLARTAAGGDPYAAESREVAVPVMQALADAGYGNP